MLVEMLEQLRGWFRRGGAFLVLAVLALPCWAVDLTQQVDFNVPSQKLSSAILEFSQQANVQIVTGIDLGDRTTPGVQGRLAIGAALLHLLQSSGLSYRVMSDTSITLFEQQSSNDATVSGTAVTQIDQTGPAATPAPVASAGSDQPSHAKTETSQAQKLDEVVVVGSRLRQSAKDSSVPINVYKREDIDRSGASTVTEFLNTLPEVSTESTTTGNIQHFPGATTVQLRGLPAGTTLLLINGRRLESSTGSTSSTTAGGFFDLSQIPLAAIERIEILPTGSSAIYGGDGLGGVVNVVLKQGFKGVEADVRYGGTSDGKYNETQSSLTAGWKSDKWWVSLIGEYAENSELSGSERSITAVGGPNGKAPYANPGNVCSTNGNNLPGLNASCAGIPAGSTGVGLTPADFANTQGVENEISEISYYSLLAPSRRYSVFASGAYQVLPSIQLFTEVLYSHLAQQSTLLPPVGAISVPASNPYNPFGEAVTVDYLYQLQKCYCENVDYFRPVVGIRGTLLNKWDWEVAGWTSRDWDNVPETHYTQNPTAISTALTNGTFNPFQHGPGASQAVLNTFFNTLLENYRGSIDSTNGFVRGPIVDLDSGTIEAVVGGEYEHDGLAWEVPTEKTENFNVYRENEAAFAELKVPIVGNHAHPEAGDIVSVQGAMRYDHYSDFGGRSSPAGGIEIRPTSSLLLRAAYSTAFKPPTLYDLYAPQFPGTVIVDDPLLGNQSETTSASSGGNPNLEAETGWSKNIGIVWSPSEIKNLDISLTNWAIHINNGFVQPTPQQIVDDPTAFPGRVTRGPPAAGQAVGPITFINESAANFGFIDEAGVDFSAKWRKHTVIGDFTPSLAITQTYRYVFAVSPLQAPTNAASQSNDYGNYAPHWKGTIALNWAKDLEQFSIDGRYTGWYRDVTDLTSDPKSLGNFWYVDINGRYELGKALMPRSKYFSQTFVVIGARNLLNKLPVSSDWGHGFEGYDPTQYDIEGRFVYGSAGIRF